MRLKAVIYLLFALLVAATAPLPSVYAQDVPATDPNIVGGSEATPGEYPWQVYLIIGQFACGGALIAPQWVLTAAHCVTDNNGTVAQPNQVMAYLGKHDLSVPEASQQVFGADQVTAHPTYNPQTMDGDLALIKLSAPAVLGNRVALLPLLTGPADDALAAPGTLATVTGWGAIVDDPNSGSLVLREVEVPIVSQTTCGAAMSAIADNQLCAGYAEGGKDSCYGDSGGALVVKNGANGWKHAGVVSYGVGCAQPNRYGVYTRTSRYVDWIDQSIGKIAVTGFSPSSGRPGTQVTISGAGFSDVSAVEFAGTSATFSASSGSTFIATVPAGAVAGPITLRTPYTSVVTTGDFEPIYRLSVQAIAAGTVTVTPDNSICTLATPCQSDWVGGTTATLSPTAGSGLVFAGWQGACAAGPDICSLLMNADQSAIAVFAPPTSTLSVAVTGEASGVVVSDIPAIDCGRTCTQQLPTRTTLTLSALPAANAIFLGWSGACSGNALTCVVTLIGDQQVGAGFALLDQPLHLPLIRR